MALLCPQCSAQLITQNFKGIDLDFCPNCHGIWFGDDELRQLLEMDANALVDLEHINIPEVAQKQGGPSSLRCPNDQCQLVQFHYLLDSPVILERCEQCGGFWVRQDELDKMQQVLNDVKKPADANELGFAHDIARHEAFMFREQWLLGFFTLLRTRSPGWFL